MDSTKNVGSPDRDRINVNEDYELQYWTEKFGVSTDRLKEAVETVGTSVKAVQEYLNK
jgi:hypothetical protein